MGGESPAAGGVDGKSAADASAGAGVETAGAQDGVQGWGGNGVGGEARTRRRRRISVRFLPLYILILCVCVCEFVFYIQLFMLMWTEMSTQGVLRDRAGMSPWTRAWLAPFRYPDQRSFFGASRADVDGKHMRGCCWQNSGIT